jgi:2-isopropylmalate synthase
MKRITIYDTTLRDGEQAPGFTMTPGEKLRIAVELEKMGVDVIEAGFPASNRDDFEAVRSISRRVRNAEISVLARAVKSDIETAWEAVKEAENPRLHIFVPTSDIQLKYQLKKTREEAANIALSALHHAKMFTGNLQFTAMDATRSDPGFLASLLSRAIEAGATTINIADTVGFVEPFEFYEMVKDLKGKIRESHRALFSVHCHNDLGLAVSNTLAAVKAGAEQVEGTINGIGERAGNAALEEVITALIIKKENYGAETGVRAERLTAVSRLLEEITGICVQPNKAVTGSNAFAHEAGIHQDGLVKNRETYEIIKPELVGRPETEFVMGKHSGRGGLRSYLEKMGYSLPESELNQLFQEFKDSLQNRKRITEDDIIRFIREVS